MNDYMIFVDLSADVDINFAKENNVGFVPMEYSIDDVVGKSEYIETEENMHVFYDKVRNGAIVKTTQITPHNYIEFFTPYCEKNIDILYFPLSSGLSKTYESACLAKRELNEQFPNVKIEVVDSLAATGGLGVLATLAIDNKKNGMDITSNAKSMAEYVKRIRHWFFVDDLTALKRGGRISSTTAFVAGMLNIKPVLEVNKEGKLDAIGKKHGVNKAINFIVDKFIEEWDGETKIVYVSHADAINHANTVKEKLLEFNADLDVRITPLSLIIGAHTGADMLAICHIGK